MAPRAHALVDTFPSANGLRRVRDRILQRGRLRAAPLLGLRGNAGKAGDLEKRAERQHEERNAHLPAPHMSRIAPRSAIRSTVTSAAGYDATSCASCA